jgi:hypothetical protein
MMSQIFDLDRVPGAAGPGHCELPPESQHRKIDDRFWQIFDSYKCISMDREHFDMVVTATIRHDNLMRFDRFFR